MESDRQYTPAYGTGFGLGGRETGIPLVEIGITVEYTERIHVQWRIGFDTLANQDFPPTISSRHKLILMGTQYTQKKITQSVKCNCFLFFFYQMYLSRIGSINKIAYCRDQALVIVPFRCFSSYVIRCLAYMPESS